VPLVLPSVLYLLAISTFLYFGLVSPPIVPAFCLALLSAPWRITAWPFLNGVVQKSKSLIKFVIQEIARSYRLFACSFYIQERRARLTAGHRRRHKVFACTTASSTLSNGITEQSSPWVACSANRYTTESYPIRRHVAIGAQSAALYSGQLRRPYLVLIVFGCIS
jgi:hypothetical protein